MEQFVLVHASVYNNNNSLNTPAVMKQDFPKYQAEQNLKYPTDSFTKEINKTLFAKADSPVDKMLFCPYIKLSKSPTLVLDGVETGVLLSDFAQQLRRKDANVSDICFTLLDAAGISRTLKLNQNANTEERGSWVPFKK